MAQTDVGPDPVTEPPVLRVNLISDDTCSTLSLSGSFVAGAIGALWALIDQLGCLHFQRVELDLSDVVAIDAVGANVVIGIHHYVEARGASFAICGATADLAATLQQIDPDLEVKRTLRT